MLALSSELQAESADIDGIPPLAKSNFSLSHWSKWQLPGHGRAYDDCGTFGYLGCLDVVAHASKSNHNGEYKGKDYLKIYKRNCARAECPVDYETWASKEAHRATRRIEAYQKQVKGTRNSPIHVIVSPSQEDIDTLDYQELRVRAQKQAQKGGVFAGIMILHPFREREDGSWYLSPHFHIVGFGWVAHAAQLYAQNGYIVKNLGVRKSVYATISYQLSHAGIYMKAEGERGKKATVTWFGYLAYTKFHYQSEPTKHVCPICEGVLHVVEWRGEGDPPLLTIDNPSDTGEYFLDASLDWVQREWFLEGT